MNIVIIGQNEGNSIIKMYNSLRHIKCNRLWILDRCSDNSSQILDGLSEHYIKTPSNIKGRQTSYSRNLGLTFTNIDSDVLFLDGDRYVTSGDLNILKKSENDIELLLLEDDDRLNIDSSDMYGRVYNGFYSCGIFLKRKALNKILNFQKGYLFNEEIQNIWGIEDTYLGDVSYHLGLTCDFNKTILLHGKFDKTMVDDIDTIRIRFELRDKLNVKWV